MVWMAIIRGAKGIGYFPHRWEPYRWSDISEEVQAFVGGLDARVYESGDRDLIRREGTRFIQGMRDRGARFVFGSDHSISYNTKYEDFKYALAVYRENMWY